jgi:hypothetical protein
MYQVVSTTRLATTAATTVNATYAEIQAMLTVASTVTTLLIYDNNTTNATHEVAKLSGAANTTAMTPPNTWIRCPSGCKVKMSTNSGRAYIYTR